MERSLIGAASWQPQPRAPSSDRLTSIAFAWSPLTRLPSAAAGHVGLDDEREEPYDLTDDARFDAAAEVGRGEREPAARGACA